MLLKTKSLSKSFARGRNSFFAVKDVDFSISASDFVFIVGRSGSGKTTFLKIIAGLIKPTAGNFKVCGKEFGIDTKKITAFLPDKNVVYPWMTSEDAINFYADFFEDFDKILKSKI